MNPKVRMTLIWVLVIFALYAVINSPERAADIVTGVGGMIGDAFKGIATFFNSLLNR